MLADAVGATPRNRGLQIAQQPETTQQITTHFAAEGVYLEGIQLYQQGTAESLRQAIGKWQEALKLWQQVDDKGSEAITLNNIGRVYDLLGEKQEALKYYNQTLPINRAVGDRGGEATTLNNIGLVYHSLGEMQEALKYYNQALPISRAVGDRGGEATTLNNIGGVYNLLGEKREALKYYNQALPILHAVGDKGVEATTLNNIGGYLGWKSLSSANLIRNQKAFFFVGYSGDFPNDSYQKYFSAGPGWTASFEEKCSIVAEERGFLLHDCATAGGSSGSPIIGVINDEPYIVALNNGEAKNLRTGQDITNFAVKISTIEQGLRSN